MIEFDIWWRIAAIGATIILVYGKIFERVRPKYYLFHCPMCIGFHVGWIFSLIFFVLYGVLETNTVLEIIKEGFICSVLSYIVAMTFSDEGINIKTNGDFHE